MEEIKKKKAGLSITSFVLALIGLILTITLILAFLGIPLLILALILGIVALVLKQKKGLAIAGVIISIITLLGILFAVMWLKNTFGGPVMDFAQQIETMIEKDPELAQILKDEKFQLLFKHNLTENFKEKYGEEHELLGKMNIKMIISDALGGYIESTILETKEEWEVMNITNTTTDDNTPAELCEEAGGTRLSEHNECEYIGAEWCNNNNGTFSECTSACRNELEAEVCTMQCVPVCILS